MPGVMSENEKYFEKNIAARKQELDKAIKENDFIFAYQIKVEINVFEKLTRISSDKGNTLRFAPDVPIEKI